MKRKLLSSAIVMMMAAPAFAAGAWIGLVLDKGEGDVKVREVVEGSPGQKAGISAGERIVAINAQPTPGPENLIAAVRLAGVGTVVKLAVVNLKGGKRTVSLTLEAKPEEGDLQ